MDRLEQVDVSTVHKPTLIAADEIEQAALSGNMGMLAVGLRNLRRALDPISIEYSVYNQLMENIDMTRRLVEVERRHLAENKRVVELTFMLEVMIAITYITMKYIPTHQDRAAAANELKEYFPTGSDITVPA
jgi:hypothetical protein